MRIGIDTGGTFTDFVLLDPSSGALTSFKVPSTPDDPSRAILAGLAQLTDLNNLHIVHGSTVATNALLERKGAKTALITTEGFRDVLHIGRQNRPALYDLLVSLPEPLVPRTLRFEVPERANHLGDIQTPLDHQALVAVIEQLKAEDVESVAVCLLFSFANPEHEQHIEAALANSGLRVSLSHRILPEFREYERTSTTTINAYVSPIMGRYLAKLAAALDDETRLQIMQSNGGMVQTAQAEQEAVRCILSGPAGGVIGAQAVARNAGFTRVLGFDMGGTSTDVSLINEEPLITTDASIDGLPIHIPMLAIHTVGAGGGSIAFKDAGGGLQVGPHSAGADPGPACYGTGDQPTVTDANVYLGRIRPEFFLNGAMPLHTDRAADAIERLAASLSIEPAACALGIIAIANAHMARALRVISVEKGVDPQDFALVSFGGAGGLHAVELARELGVRTVLVPPQAGTLSALGMLLADVVKDYSRTVMLPGTTSFEALDKRLASLYDQAQHDLLSEGIAEAAMRFEPSLDMRYAGQSFELSVLFTADFAKAFHQLHDKQYGYHQPEAAIEIVNLRLKAIGQVDKPALAAIPEGQRAQSKDAIAHHLVTFDAGPLETAFYAGRDLRPMQHIDGPAMVVYPDTTVLLTAADQARVDAFGNLIISIGERDAH